MGGGGGGGGEQIIIKDSGGGGGVYIIHIDIRSFSAIYNFSICPAAVKRH